MVRFLPPGPNLEHLKNQAKALHKAHRRRDPEVCAVLRHVHRFRDASDDKILSADVPLTEAQFALAMEYGFVGWQELRKAVLNLKPTADHVPEARGDAMILPNPLPGVGAGNRLAAACSMALTYVGATADYETVAGDLGTAFILQADAHHKPFNTNVKQLDIGWWPLDPWGAMLRLDFLGKVFGVPMRQLPTVMAEYKADPAGHYRKHHEAEVIGSMLAGRPVVTIVRDTCVVFGWDGGNPPLLGQLVCSCDLELSRLEAFPWVVVVLGQPGEPMDRRQADAEALDFAIRLGRDEVDLSDRPGKSTGRRSWELWAGQLADAELCSPHFYHANVVGHLQQNRKTAAVYLRSMSQRHGPPARDALARAAEDFDAVAAKMQEANTSEEALSAAAGRDELISLIRQAMNIEATAQQCMAEAAGNL